MKLEAIRALFNERISMAPLPWEYTRRFDSDRLECANGNVILDLEDNNQKNIVCTDDLKALVAGWNEIGKLLAAIETLEWIAADGEKHIEDWGYGGVIDRCKEALTALEAE